MRKNEAGTTTGLLPLSAGHPCRRRFSRAFLLALTFTLSACASHAPPESGTPPLVVFFVDGVRLSQEAADALWDRTDLGRDADSVCVLKDPASLNRYGAKGRPGVVLVYLRGGE